MKTSRLLMIATVLAITSISFSYTNVLKADQLSSSRMVLNLTLQQALQNPDLAMTMHQQLSDDFLGNGEASVFTVRIFFANYLVYVSGTYEEWTLFFHTSLENGSGSQIE